MIKQSSKDAYLLTTKSEQDAHEQIIGVNSAFNNAKKARTNAQLLAKIDRMRKKGRNSNG